MMLKRDMTEVHEAPPKSIRKQRITGERSSAMLKMTPANVAVAADSNVSEEIFERVRCSTIAPATAPNPKKPSRKPYVIGFSLISFAAVGKRAQKELVKKMRTAERSRRVRMPGEYRT
jgi:hypothetical protein